ncbi:heavy metal-binding domain-containing protein [Sphingobacterium siyangense]|uniref:heavy metal-binding domain-containing protein n=1 Tax=Sphingobacterium siyangense TaxID=459529 RepID=UPI003DA36008
MLIAVSLLIQHTNTNSNLSIAANVVIGIEIFSDIAASYVDFFGGRSISYEKKMQEMYNRVIATL